MTQGEIINELQQIVALTDYPSTCESSQSLARYADSDSTGGSGSDFAIVCHDAHEAAQRAKGLILEVKSWPPWPWSPRNEPVDASQQPAEPTPPAERHIDTPDELLELLAGISSDPQIEGLSLAQKTSSMALLHIAKALQQIVRKVRHRTSPALSSPPIASRSRAKAHREAKHGRSATFRQA
jgi:hypothetical protein